MKEEKNWVVFITLEQLKEVIKLFEHGIELRLDCKIGCCSRGVGNDPVMVCSIIISKEYFAEIPNKFTLEEFKKIFIEEGFVQGDCKF